MTRLVRFLSWRGGNLLHHVSGYVTRAAVWLNTRETVYRKWREARQ